MVAQLVERRCEVPKVGGSNPPCTTNNNQFIKTMCEKLESKLLSAFEKIKGYNSYMFDIADWKEFDAFVAGYNLERIVEKDLSYIHYKINQRSYLASPREIRDSEVIHNRNRIFITFNFDEIESMQPYYLLPYMQNSIKKSLFFTKF